jgi:hypothetical protein
MEDSFFKFTTAETHSVWGDDKVMEEFFGNSLNSDYDDRWTLALYRAIRRNKMALVHHILGESSVSELSSKQKEHALWCAIESLDQDMLRYILGLFCDLPISCRCRVLIRAAAKDNLKSMASFLVECCKMYQEDVEKELPQLKIYVRDDLDLPKVDRDRVEAFYKEMPRRQQ